MLRKNFSTIFANFWQYLLRDTEVEKKSTCKKNIYAPNLSSKAEKYIERLRESISNKKFKLSFYFKEKII